MTLLGLPKTALAGMFELGASSSYRSSTITKDNYSKQESYTGSLSYYFTEATAIELSYTQGFARAVGRDNNVSWETRAYFTVYGADFILTIGAKDSFIRPYLKAGAAYVYKEIYYRQEGLDPLPPVRSAGVAPSGGIGFRLLLADNFTIRAGVEGQSSPIKDEYAREGEQRDPVIDIAAKAGVSWMF